MSFFKRLYQRIFITTAILSVMFVSGCELPSYSLVESGTPSEALTEFIHAVNLEDEAAINNLLYNCTWSNDMEEQTDASDKELFEALRKSRSILIQEERFTDSEKKNAWLSVLLTAFSMSLFEEKLTERVKKEVTNRMFEGESFTQPSDTSGIIESCKHQLLKEPDHFYRTAKINVHMVFGNGRWRVELTDELYHTLLGLD